MTKRHLLIAITILATVLLSGCNFFSNDNNSATAPTVNSFAKGQINTATCNQGSPQDINSVTFASDETPVDVTTLKPACTQPGG
ncbi:MAG: hypothetical protein ACRETW_03535 [Stenotrophobium sp.]